MDLADLRSVERAIDVLSDQYGHLDLLLNNAGVMAPPRQLSPQGHELQFAVNHLGHMALTQGLLPLMASQTDARVVSVTSGAQYFGTIRWDDLSWAKGYDRYGAYGQSKSANILHAVQLHKLLGAHGVTACSLHPGVITDGSDLWRHAGNVMRASKTVPQGAATSVYCAMAPDVVGGGFYSDCHQAAAADWATDPAIAERLWEETAKIVAGK